MVNGKEKEVTLDEISKGDILIKNCIPEHLDCITAKILEIGGNVEDLGDAIRVSMTKRPNKATVKTLPYPGYPSPGYRRCHPQKYSFQ